MKFQSVLIVLCLVLTAALVASLVGSPAIAQPAATEGAATGLPFELPAMPGKFQMALERMNNSNNTIVVVCDTSTGQCWHGLVGSQQWHTMSSPAQAK